MRVYAWQGVARRALPTFGALLLAALPAAAQVTDNREEATVQAVETPEEAPRESLLDEARQGPQISHSIFEETIPIDQIERTETAITRLRRLVDTTDEEDAARAEYMFRLAELYYDNAKFYEQRAYQRRDRAFELQASNPAQAQAYEEQANDDLTRSDQYSQDAVVLYADIYELYHDSFDSIDAVLYYLGANLLQLGHNEDALMFFGELAQNYSQSPYMPQAFLLMGELEFALNHVQDAYAYFDAVTQFPDSNVYEYAKYKKAWCLYNMARDEEGFGDAMALMLEVVEEAGASSNDTVRRLRRDALRDSTLFYIEIAGGDQAVDFYSQLAEGDELFDLISRLARLFADKGSYEESNTLFRELIAMNPNSFDIVEYQEEIVRNTRPMDNDVELVREARRLVEIYQLASGFEGVDPGTAHRKGDAIELAVRQLATTYHSEAQTTHNESFYDLAFNLYQDYTGAFPDHPNAYAIWFYYGELLYNQESWELAADAYDHALRLGGGQGQYDAEANHAACLAYAKLIGDISGAATTTTSVSSGSGSADEGALPPIPEPREIPDQYSRMFRSCDAYLASEPGSEAAVEIQYVIAYLYYDYDHLDEAATRFGDLALNAYNIDPERASYSAELLLDSLALMRRFSDMREWLDRLIQTPLNQGELGTRLTLLREQVTFNECRDLMDTNRNADAAQCFVEFVQNHFESSLVDRALYNAGFCFERDNQIDFALSMYQYVSEYRPDSDIVPDTLYQIARTYHRLAIYSEAASYYEQYQQRDPDGDNVIRAMANASQFRQGLEQYDQAIADLRIFMRISDEDDEEQNRGIAEASYQIAEIQRQRGQLDDAVRSYQRFIDEYGEILPSRSLEAHVHIADIYAGNSRTMERAYEWYQRTLDTVSGLDTEVRAQLEAPALDAAAKSQFMLGEQIFEEFEAIPLEGDEAEVQAALTEKIQIGRRAAAVYDAVFEFGRPGWAIAAFTRLGQLYHVFFMQVIDAPVPDFDDPLVEEQYRVAIEDQAAQQKEIAIDRYVRAIEIARSSGWFNEYSEQAAQFLQELDPTFKSGAEIRIAPGYDSVHFYAPPFVSSLGEGSEETGAPTEEATPEERDSSSPAPPPDSGTGGEI